MALHTTPCCCWQCKGTNSSLIRKQTFMIICGLSLFLLSSGTYFLLKILRLHSILLWIAILSYPTLLEFYFSGMKYAHIPSIFFFASTGNLFPLSHLCSEPNMFPLGSPPWKHQMSPWNIHGTYKFSSLIRAHGFYLNLPCVFISCPLVTVVLPHCCSPNFQTHRLVPTLGTWYSVFSL